MDMVVNHPMPGEESHDSWLAEREAVLSSLASRARLVASVLNTIPGISCNTVQGAMYAFPQIKIPQKVGSSASVRLNHPLDSIPGHRGSP